MKINSIDFLENDMNSQSTLLSRKIYVNKNESAL